ncbi:MAG: FtsH protease activity modulator HflK [Coxiellaceae bacterium]|nr:FtsH protease activity modulator HflK [Coxiellaceae bacterium]
MAWNDDNKDKDPWSGRGSNDQNPPDLSKIFGNIFKKAKAKAGGSGGSEGGDSDNNRGLAIIISFVVIVIVALWFLSGIFVVPPTDQAVVLRFGKYTETVGPGMHWIPQMIQSKYEVNVQQINSFDYQSEMLTEDENIVSATIAVQYRIGKPEQFLFNVVDPINTLKEATSSALRQVVGETTLDDILTIGRQKVRDEVQQQLTQILTSYKTGIEVTDVNLQPAKPPAEVTAAFDDAIKAREDEQKYINQAEAYARQVESKVKGQVARIQQDAKAYQQEVVFQSQGKTARYEALLVPYKSAPAVTRERMYFDAISQILANTVNVFDETNGRNILYLPIDGKHSVKANNGTQVPYRTNVTASTTTSHINGSSTARTAAFAADSGDLFPNRPSSPNPYGDLN